MRARPVHPGLDAGASRRLPIRHGASAARSPAGGSTRRGREASARTRPAARVISSDGAPLVSAPSGETPRRRGAGTSVASTAAIAAASLMTIAFASAQTSANVVLTGSGWALARSGEETCGSQKRFKTTCVVPRTVRTDRRCTDDVMPPSIRRPPVTTAPAPTVRSTQASCARVGNRRIESTFAVMLSRMSVGATRTRPP